MLVQQGSPAEHDVRRGAASFDQGVDQEALAVARRLVVLVEVERAQQGEVEEAHGRSGLETGVAHDGDGVEERIGADVVELTTVTAPPNRIKFAAAGAYLPDAES